MVLSHCKSKLLYQVESATTARIYYRTRNCYVVARSLPVIVNHNQVQQPPSF